MNIAIVGATGNVGRKLIEVLEKVNNLIGQSHKSIDGMYWTDEVFMQKPDSQRE